jgi:multidrug efflux pump subunit AcrA (membrane-fusion protein)
VLPRLPLLLTLCAALAAAALQSAAAAGPPLPVPIPDTAQDRLQARIAIQQAQAQASIAAQQARLQAQLDANQARLEGQVAAREQAQLNAARRGAASAAPGLSLPLALPMQQPLSDMAGTMQLATLSPRLGSYFGTDRGILVVRAPAHGVLKLQDGDVILSIGGRVPASSSQAIRILTSYDPGQPIDLEILREHRRMKITTRMPGLAAEP